MTLFDLKWLTILLPIICFIAIGVLQYFFFFACISCNKRGFIATQSGLFAFIFGLAFWIGSVFASAPDNYTSVLVFAFIFTIVLDAISLIPIVYWIKFHSGFSAYYYSIAIQDLSLIATVIASSIILSGNASVNSTMIPLFFAVLLIIFGTIMVIMYAIPNAFRATVLKFGPLADSLPVQNGKRVKVVLLTGQSNASGVCRIPYLRKKDPEKYDKVKNGFGNVWISYFNDNGAQNSKGFVNVKPGQGCNKKCFGPELGIAEKLSEFFGNEPVFIIKYAWGGSNMHTQWLSTTSAINEGREEGKLYQAFLTFTKLSLAHLEKKGYIPEIVANCWMQGESDSFGEYVAPYQMRTFNYIYDSQNELRSYIGDTKLAFIDAGISDSKLANGKYLWPEFVEINRQKSELATSGHSIYLDTVSEGLACNTEPTGEFGDPHIIDYAHYDATSGIKLGNMFGNEIINHITKNQG